MLVDQVTVGFKVRIYMRPTLSFVEAEVSIATQRLQETTASKGVFVLLERLFRSVHRLEPRAMVGYAGKNRHANEEMAMDACGESIEARTSFSVAVCTSMTNLTLR